MADDGAPATGHHGRERRRVASERAVTDRVDAAMDRMQPPPPDPVVDARGAEPEADELRAGHETALTRRQGGDPSVPPARVTFPLHQRG